MSYEVIKVDRQDRVAVVTLNRPEVLNALSYQLVRELDEAVTEMAEDDGVGAIVLTGMGERAFPPEPTFTRTGSLGMRRGTVSPRSARTSRGVWLPAPNPSSEPSTVCVTAAGQLWPPAWTFCWGVSAPVSAFWRSITVR